MANQLLIKGAADIAKSKGFNDGFMDAADNLQKWGAMAELQVEDRRKKAEAADAKVIDYLDKMPSSQGLPKVPLNAQAPVAKYLKDSRAEYAAHAKATRDLDPTSTEYADHIEGMNSITAKWGRLNDQMLSFNESKISYVEAVNEQAISYGTKPEDREVLSNVYSEDGTVDVNEDKPVTVVAVLPNVNAVLPSVVTPAVDNIAFDTPPALTFNESPVISIEESSTSTLNAVPEPPAKPAPATEEFN